MPTGPISKATASEYAKMGQEARRQRFRELEAKAELCDQYEKQLAELATKPQPEALLTDYDKKRLVRVRKQLDKLDRMIENEEDPQKLDRLASAQSRLAKQEQELSGRPLPGSLRPGNKKQAQRSSNIPDPIE